MSGQNRETFGSFGGAILAMAGMAIGLGNIWRFPYMMGAFGGGWFLITYAGFVLVVGVPALLCEWTLGRHTRQHPVGAFRTAGLRGGRFWGGLFTLTVFMTASYYVVVVGWVTRYAIVYLAGQSPGDAPGADFASFTGSVGAQAVFVYPCIALSVVVLRFGLRGGMERFGKLATPLFLLFFLVLASRSLALETGAQKMIDYFIAGSHFSPRTVLAAMGQGFFSLALGGTVMVTLGSFLQRDHSIPRGVAATAVLDTGASLLATLVLVPPALVFAVPLTSGPALLFDVAPTLFSAMPGGRFAGALFFVAIWFCAMLSMMSAYELIAGGIEEAWGWSRNRALLFVLGSQSVLSVPAMMNIDYIFYSDLFWGSTMHPIGAAASVLAVAWFLGRARLAAELAQGSDFRLPAWLYYWIRYVVPVAICAGLLYGWTG